MFCRKKLILWTETSIISKFVFEAVKRNIRDINDRSDSPFGEIIFVMCDDFRQVLPVVYKELCLSVVAASIKESDLWRHVHVWRLRKHMHAINAASIADLRNKIFSDWLLVVDEDRIRCSDAMSSRSKTLNGLINVVITALRMRE